MSRIHWWGADLFLRGLCIEELVFTAGLTENPIVGTSWTFMFVGGYRLTLSLYKTFVLMSLYVCKTHPSVRNQRR